MSHGPWLMDDPHLDRVLEQRLGSWIKQTSMTRPWLLIKIPIFQVSVNKSSL